jgi:asparagine synthase (glutamine-hydrolysing)
MCGICGFANLEGAQNTDDRILKDMCRVLYHRGPDDEGYYSDQLVGLGMRRLSIIDLVTGQQPITNEDDSLWIVFNGEIYNYLELHDRLVQKGHNFKTKSDTEVIIHAYEEYGDRCVEHFNGMFAFALWDKPKRRLLIGRDHIGIKPLYYWRQGPKIVFGSELKAVIAHPDVPKVVDPVAVDHFLTLEYIPAPRTIFKDIFKLPPGCILIFQDGFLKIEQYWDIHYREIYDDESTLVDKLSYLLADAVRLQMVSDVPLGAFLSGGIDSSTVVAYMSKASDIPIKTFSIGFGDKTYNELPYARVVASHFNTDHYEEFLEPDIADLAERLIRHMDEPFGDFSIFPTYLVSQIAREHVKVVLSGDGGDELFGGYETYLAQSYDRYYRYLPNIVRRDLLPKIMDMVPPQPAKKGFINKTKRFIEGAALSSSLQHSRWMIFMNDEDKRALYKPGLLNTLDGKTVDRVLQGYFQRMKQANALTQQQYVDVKTYLVDDILTKVDRMSMAVSLEARVPLLDYRIAEFAVNLPAHLKLHRGKTKWILRQAVANRLPDVILKKPKEGFSIPIKHWLRGPLKPLMMDLLSDESIRNRGYFEPRCAQTWISEHLEGAANHSHRLWALMVFELWYRNILESK